VPQVNLTLFLKQAIMSYLVFARKWRPLTFDDVVGQEHITATLKKAIEKNRVAHAYIFTGTRGVGKTTTARILARALNCDKGPTPNPCGTCEPCKNIIGGSSFDVLEIDGASNNSVDDIREIRDNVRYSSMGGKYRIYVIDEVHMLSKSAFNALLKTLEEPPKNVIFIFATTEPQKIPATIHSRCQRFDFRRIATEQITARIEHICKAENIAFDHNALLLVGRKAEGSMRDGLSLLDQVYSYSQDAIDETAVRAALGIISNEIYDSILAAIAAKNPEPVLSVVEDILSRGFDLGEFIDGLLDYLRTMLFSRLPKVLDNPRIDLASGASDALRKHAAGFSEATLLRMAEIVRKAQNELKWSSFPRFSVEIMLLKLVHLDETVSIESLLSALGDTGSGAANAPVLPDKKKNDIGAPAVAILAKPEENPPAPPPAAEPEPRAVMACLPDERPVESKPLSSPDQTGSGHDVQDWPHFIEHLQKNRPHLAYHFGVASLVSLSREKVDLRFPKVFHFQFSEVNKKKNRDEIQKELDDFFQGAVVLHMTLEATDGQQAAQTQAPATAAAAERAFMSIDDEIAHEPIIKNVLDIFDGCVM
jgi:DNA polymerase-3 subunit gamma/tau